MAPFIYPSPKREDSYKHYCSGGHEYREDNHWRCYGCKLWFPEHVSHGCSGTSETLRGYSPEKRQLSNEKLFLLDKRNQEVQQHWKRSKYAKVNAQFRI